MKNLFISELLLLSRKERKAKRIAFDKHRTLIHGKNHTGKSSLIKSIYRTFGAETTLNPKFLNANVISCVRFEIDGNSYQMIRDDRRFAIYNADDKLECVFNSVSKELAPFLSNLFNFKPLFQAQSGGFVIPPPAYLLLPFYIDQDESWTKSWSSFKNLQQIKKYRNQCIEYHSGIRPNSYFETKKEIDGYLKNIEETDKEQKITKKILNDVKESLSQSEFNIDIEEFREEISELLTELEKLKAKEEKIKEGLHELYHLKAVYDAQINIITQAVKESHKDLRFATETLPSVIGCPTCGAEYENSFSERFEIAQDEQRSRDLLIEVNQEANDIEEKIKIESEKLNKTIAEAKKIDEILERKKGELKLKDVIESSGKNHVRKIFMERYNELQKIIIENSIEKDKLEKQLKDLESKERKNEINLFYRSTLSSFLKKLDVHSLAQEEYKKITTKIESLETGSSRPRALIAYYFSFFHLMKKCSSATYFPLIIDSPNQQDQDVEHIDKIMNFIDSNQPDNTQMILGVAETYGIDFKCPTIHLEEKYNLLQENEFESVNIELEEKLFEMWQR
jgi:DNA repair exonuclease SbcCD ATPase subunit